MAGRFSDDDHSVGHEADFVDASTDMEVDVRLHLEVVRRSDPLQEDVRTSPGVADDGAVDLKQQEQCRFEPPNETRSKWPRHELPLPNFLGSGSGEQDFQGFPGPGGPWPRVGTQFDPDTYEDGLKTSLPRSSDETAGWAWWAGLVSGRYVDGHRGPSAA